MTRPRSQVFPEVGSPAAALHIRDRGRGRDSRLVLKKAAGHFFGLNFFFLIKSFFFFL